MIDLQQLGPFIAAVLVLLFLPGADMVLVTRQVVVHGTRAGFTTLAGIFTAGLLHLTLATVGVSAMIASSERAFLAIKAIGAGYLIFLGVSTLRHLRAKDDDSDVGSTSVAPADATQRAFAVGFLTNISNPKVAVFFLTFLPQFVVGQESAALQLVTWGGLFMVIALAWWIAYILLLKWASSWLYRPTVRRVFEAMTGSALILLGLRLAVQRL